MRFLLFLLLMTPPAQAGPWVRPKGETYIFIGHEEGIDGWTSLYAERGGRHDLTFGLDVGGHAMGAVLGDPSLPLDGRIRSFVRLPLWSSEDARAARPGWLAHWLLAVEAGIGQDLEANGDVAIRYSFGVSIGRPLTTRLGGGWTTLDLRATAGGGKRRRLNAQYVVGVKPTSRLTLELGLFAEHETSLSTAIAPTVQYGLGRIGNARLGVSLKDGSDMIFRIGWAQSF